MRQVSVVICGVKYAEFDIRHSVKAIRESFPGAEVILSTNDSSFYAECKAYNVFDKCVLASDPGALPPLKLVGQESNNVNRMVVTALDGIRSAANDLVLRLRTDQIITNGSLLTLWEELEKLRSNDDSGSCSRIITSSIFSINPRFSERMPYHIGDMIQFGCKDDLIRYFEVPEYPFEYAVWYEYNPHAPGSSYYEKQFRAKYAVEQWLTLHYIFGDEKKFPIGYHNHVDGKIVEEMEIHCFKYFFVASPLDIGLRASKFDSAKLYYITQCYATEDSLSYISSGSLSRRWTWGVQELYRIRELSVFSSLWRLLPAGLRRAVKEKLVR